MFLSFIHWDFFLSLRIEINMYRLENSWLFPLKFNYHRLDYIVLDTFQAIAMTSLAIIFTNYILIHVHGEWKYLAWTSNRNRWLGTFNDNNEIEKFCKLLIWENHAFESAKSHRLVPKRNRFVFGNVSFGSDRKLVRDMSWKCRS